jgi:adenylate kinase
MSYKELWSCIFGSSVYLIFRAITAHRMKIVLVGGTPCTGKSSVSMLLGRKLGRPVVNIGQLALDNECISEFDADRETSVIDEDCLAQAISDYLEDEEHDLIIEGHYVDLIPGGYVERVFILRTHPDELALRLRNRGYSKEKVDENVESEIFGVCQLDAINAFGEEKVYEVDSSKASTESVVEEILSHLKSGDVSPRYDWMVELEQQGRLDEYLR